MHLGLQGVLGLLVKNSALLVVGMHFVSIVQDRIVWCASFLAHVNNVQLLKHLRKCAILFSALKKCVI